MNPEELKAQLDTMKAAYDTASNTMRASLKADIDAAEAKLAEMKAASDTKLNDIDTKLAKVIEAQDGMLARQNDLKLAADKKTVKSFGELLNESMEENTDAIAKFARKETNKVSFQLKAVGDMGFSANFGTASQSTANVRPGIITDPNRRTHIRDLVPQGTMDGSTFYYVKENGVGEGSIGTVAENATKPQIDLDLIEANANAEYIAGWLRISKKMLADVKGMTAFLQMRLMEKLLRAEDNQLLNGNGTTPNISGITDTGNFTAYNGGDGVDIEDLVNAISQLEDEEERYANGILLRPADYYRLALNKASGSGEYDLPGIVTLANGRLNIAGVPVYASTAATDGQFIVGDWRMGAMLLTREPAVVEFFYEDGTNVRENKVTVRVEERVAFPIFGDNYFIVGNFGDNS